MRTCHTSGKCYSGSLWMGKQVASGNQHRARAQPQVGGMANVRTNVPLSGDERADRYQFASYCIRCASLTPPHMHARARVGRSACRFVYHCCSLRADLFQKSEGGGREKAEGVGSGSENWGGREGARRHIDGCGLCCGFYEIGLPSLPNLDISFRMCKTSEKATLSRRRQRRTEGKLEGGRGRRLRARRAG